MSPLLRIQTVQLRGDVSTPCFLSNKPNCSPEMSVFTSTVNLLNSNSVPVHIRSQEKTSAKRSRVLDDDDEEEGISHCWN